MIITNRTSGPRFSTDAVAHDVSRFAARRRALPSYDGPRDGASGYTVSLEELHPWLFENPATPAGSVFATVRNGLAAGARMLAGRRGARPAVTGLVLAIALAAPHPASADFPVFGNGYGHAADEPGAFAMAAGEAEDSMATDCPAGEITNLRVVESTRNWNGLEYQSTIRLAAFCG